jgi:hypothetical protein
LVPSFEERACIEGLFRTKREECLNLRRRKEQGRENFVIFVNFTLLLISLGYPN